MTAEPAAAADICVICLEGGAVSRCQHYPGCACRECCFHEPCFQAYGANKPCPVCRLPSQQQPDTVIDLPQETIFPTRAQLHHIQMCIATLWCWGTAALLVWAATQESDSVQLGFCLTNAGLYAVEGLVLICPYCSFDCCCGRAVWHYTFFRVVLLFLGCLYAFQHPSSEPLYWAAIMMLSQLCLSGIMLNRFILLLLCTNGDRE